MGFISKQCIFEMEAKPWLDVQMVRNLFKVSWYCFSELRKNWKNVGKFEKMGKKSQNRIWNILEIEMRNSFGSKIRKETKKKIEKNKKHPDQSSFIHFVHGEGRKKASGNSNFP